MKNPLNYHQKVSHRYFFHFQSPSHLPLPFSPPPHLPYFPYLPHFPYFPYFPYIPYSPSSFFPARAMSNSLRILETMMVEVLVGSMGGASSTRSAPTMFRGRIT